MGGMTEDQKFNDVIARASTAIRDIDWEVLTTAQFAAIAALLELFPMKDPEPEPERHLRSVGDQV